MLIIMITIVIMIMINATMQCTGHVWVCATLPADQDFFDQDGSLSLQVTPAHFEVTMMIILSINNINHFKVTIITLPDCHHFNRQRYEDNHYLSISTHKFVVENYILFACLGVNSTIDVNHCHQHWCEYQHHDRWEIHHQHQYHGE